MLNYSANELNEAKSRHHFLPYPYLVLVLVPVLGLPLSCGCGQVLVLHLYDFSEYLKRDLPDVLFYAGGNVS